MPIPKHFYMPILIHMPTWLSLFICTFICICICLYMCTFIYIYTTGVSMPIPKYMQMHICMCKFMPMPTH